MTSGETGEPEENLQQKYGQTKQNIAEVRKGEKRNLT